MENKNFGISGYDSVESFKASLETHVPPTTQNKVNENILTILSGLMDIVQEYRMIVKSNGDLQKFDGLNFKLKSLGFNIEDVKEGLMKWTLK